MSQYDNPILVCDDHHDLVRLLTDSFEERGYRAIGVHRGGEVVPLLRVKPIDIVILDISLTDMNGLEVLRAIKNEEPRLGRFVRVCMLTAHKDAKLASAVLDMGAYYFFHKPVKFDTILERVEQAISELQQERQAIDETRQRDELSLPDAMQRYADERAEPNLPALRFPFDHAAIVESAPAGPGVITLRDKTERPIWVQWVDHIKRTLTLLEALPPEESRQGRHARSFAYVVTTDSSLAGLMFDRFVNELGAFPSCMDAAPKGSKYEGKPESHLATAGDANITQAGSALNPALVDDIRTMYVQHPDDANIKEAYAFMCYNSGDYDQAQKLYCELVLHDASRNEPHFYLANILYKKGLIKDAIARWELVVERAPKDILGRKSARRILKAQTEQ